MNPFSMLQSWPSPNNTFSVGFIVDGSAYFVIITYNNILVWKAGGDSGDADSCASFQFLSNDNLHLVNSSDTVVWQSNIAGRGVSSVALDDSGNFILRNSTDLVWSTFDNPTGTLLPNQNFTSSKKLESGLFSFRLLISRNLTLQWNNSIVYWNSSVNSSININFTSLILRLQSIGLLSLTDPSSSASVIMAYSSDYVEEADILRFLKLDSDENLRIYSSPKGSGPTVPNPSASSLGNEKGNVTILCLVTLEGGLWWWCCRNSPKFGDLSTQYVLLEYASGALVQFSYKELQRAIEGFKEKLGAGGFGAVYRGFLANKTVVAVKQLEGIK
ncbi:hypothetical protein ACSBR2_010033 [Camellia fascicularis]